MIFESRAETVLALEKERAIFVGVEMLQKIFCIQKSSAAALYFSWDYFVSFRWGWDA